MFHWHIWCVMVSSLPRTSSALPLCRRQEYRGTTTFVIITICTILSFNNKCSKPSQRSFYDLFCASLGQKYRGTATFVNITICTFLCFHVKCSKPSQKSSLDLFCASLGQKYRGTATFVNITIDTFFVL